MRCIYYDASAKAHPEAVSLNGCLYARAPTAEQVVGRAATETQGPSSRPLHILLEKKAIRLKRIASKKGYSARDYAPKVLLCSNYASVKIDIPGFKILKHDK